MAITEREVSNYDLPLILFDIHGSSKTGTLSVTSAGITKKVYFQRGSAIFASSTSEDDRLGEMLVKLGQITHKQYEESVRILCATGKKQGAILVGLGYLTPKDLILGVQYQVREIIYSLFRLKDAEYEFTEGQIPSEEVIPLQMSMGKLIYEGLRRNNNLSVIRRGIPDMQAIVKLRERRPDILSDIVLNTSDEEMLSLIDGKKTVSEIIKSFSSQYFEALKSLYVLHTMGFTEIQREPSDSFEEIVTPAESRAPHPQTDDQSSKAEQKPFESPSSKITGEISRAGFSEEPLDAEEVFTDNTSDHDMTVETAETDDLPVTSTADVESSASLGSNRDAAVQKDAAEGRERRRHKRYKVEGAAVYGEMLFKKEVNVLDMSVSGIALLTDRQLKIGIEYVLNLQDEEQTISAKAVVVRSMLSHSKTDGSGNVIPLYFVGMQFTNLSEQKTREILRFIDNHKAGDQKTSAEGEQTEPIENARFQISDAGKTVINFQDFYKVKVISLTGMLIDSSHFLNVNDRLHMRILIHEGRMIDFVGRVASCVEKTDGHLRHYDIGVEFTEMSDEHKRLLEDFCANIENMQNVNISAFQTEAREKAKTPDTQIPATGDADLHILEGKYADAMAIYRRLLSENPDNIHILKRIEALSSLMEKMGDKKPNDEAPQMTAREVTGQMKKLPDRRSSALGSTPKDKYRENDSPPRWYSKFMKRIT